MAPKIEEYKDSNLNLEGGFFKNIDLNCLDLLHKRVKYILKNDYSKVIFKNLSQIYPKETVKLKDSLNDNIEMNKFLTSFKETDTKFYSIIEYDKKVIANNKTVILPKDNELLTEKENILTWIGYNTPTSTNFTVTPLLGTSFCEDIDPSLLDLSPLSLYRQWMISMYYLIWEYNIVIKVKSYLEEDNDKFLNNLEYIEAYCYWINRQTLIQGISSEDSFNKGQFIVNFSLDDENFYREICEDYVYITLNIILAKSILDNSNLNSNITNRDKFFLILRSILTDHMNKYKDQYKCLNLLRIYRLNNLCSVKSLKDLSKEIEEENEKKGGK
jgi:hypothetical protein